MSEIDCPRAGRWRGCNFEARYDVINGPPKPPNDTLITSWKVTGPPGSRTYVRDVCTRCGRTIERVPPRAPADEG